MKNIITITSTVALLIGSLACIGQITAPPECFAYQAVLRDNQGAVMANQSTFFVISLVENTDGNGNGPVAYSEIHSTVTNQFGLATLHVGCGNVLSGNFGDINWGHKSYWLEVHVNGSILGKAPLLSVPYANWAKGNGEWNNSGDSSIYYSGNVGINIDNPSYPLHIVGNNIRIDGVEDADLNLNISSSSVNNPEVRFLIDGEEEGFIRLRHTASDLLIYEGLSTSGTFMFLKNGRVGIGTSSPQTTLHVNGTTTTEILRITGGDIAEARHPISGQELLPGMVVVFDENERGKIRTTTKAYDKKAAGVISGMGKYFAGVCLLEDELTKGALPLAQIGTVEVLAVGPIQVGDLLTTSTIPGHAMAATNSYKSIGAVIGKAISTLKANEKGVVEMQIEKH